MRLAGSHRSVALTPLIAAVNSGRPGLVMQLLEAGADLHQKCTASAGGRGADWTSALSSAVLSGSLEMVQVLVEAGACGGRKGGVSIGQDHPGLRAVALAAQRGRTDMLDLLYPPLARALQGGSAAMLGTLKRRTVLHPLAAAAQHGQLAAVERLLELGAPPSHCSSVVAGVLQHTPLMLAAASGHLAVMERLLAAGACPLKVNGCEHTTAALALQQGQLEAVRLLLRHTGELAAPEEQRAAVQDGGTAVQGGAAGSAVAGDPTAVPPVAAPPQAARNTAAALAPAFVSPTLLANNASKAWQLGFTGSMLPRQRPLTLSALEQERQRYQLLLLALLEVHAAGGGAASPAAARMRSLAGPTALAHAAAGSETLLDAVLACGASLACVDPSDGSFPLLAACYHGWTPMLRLLHRGADVNQADSSGSTVLMLMASRPGMLGTAHQLLRWHAGLARGQRGLDLGRRNVAGRDAVGVAIAARNRRFAEALLDHLMAQQQAEVATVRAARAQQQQAGTPAPTPVLEPAPVPAATATVRPAGGVGVASVGAGKAYDLLVELGASCVADINRPGKDGQHLLLSQARAGSCKQLRQALALPGIDVNTRDGSRRTPLMLAVARQQPALVLEVLGCGGADVDARDGGGRSAALLAAQAGNGHVLRLLLSAGADVDLADNKGLTPLMALAAGGQHKLLAELLRAPRPPSLNARDRRGWSALHHAGVAGSFNACKVLRGWGADAGLRSVEGGYTALDLARQGGHAACLPLLVPPLVPGVEQ